MHCHKSARYSRLKPRTVLPAHRTATTRFSNGLCCQHQPMWRRGLQTSARCSPHSRADGTFNLAWSVDDSGSWPGPKGLSAKLYWIWRVGGSTICVHMREPPSRGRALPFCSSTAVRTTKPAYAATGWLERRMGAKGSKDPRLNVPETGISRSSKTAISLPPLVSEQKEVSSIGAEDPPPEASPPRRSGSLPVRLSSLLPGASHGSLDTWGVETSFGFSSQVTPQDASFGRATAPSDAASCNTQAGSQSYWFPTANSRQLAPCGPSDPAAVDQLSQSCRLVRLYRELLLCPSFRAPITCLTCDCRLQKWHRYLQPSLQLRTAPFLQHMGSLFHRHQSCQLGALG